MALISANKSSANSVDMNSMMEKLAAKADSVDRNAAFPSDSVRLLGDGQLLGLVVPARFGGLEADAETFARIVQSVAEACASTGMIFVMHCCAMETLARHHFDAGDVLQAAAKGDHLSTLACSEQGTGANFYASFAQSTESADGYFLSGDKCFVTSGGHADSYVVSTQAVGSEDAVNTALYWVRKDTPGLLFNGTWSGLGLRGNNSIRMNLDNCKVPKSSLIGTQGQGLEIEMGTILPRFLLGSAAVYNGIARAALKSLIEHAKSRIHAHTGEALSAFPVLRSNIGQMKIEVESSLAFTASAARSMNEGSETALVELLSAKQLACSTAVSATTRAMECAGGIAFAGALPIERHFRDAQAGVVMAPTNAMLLDLVGRAALGMPLM